MTAAPATAMWRSATGRGLQDHEWDLAVGPVLVGLVPAIGLDDLGPQAFAFLRAGLAAANGHAAVADLDADVRAGQHVVEPRRVLGVAALARDDHVVAAVAD